jgi:phenylacetic acid degradation protein
MPCYAIDGLIPVVHPQAFVHPTAALIGDVVVAAGVYVGPGASLRGDFGRIELHEGSNLQDNCVMHSFPGRAAVVEANGHVGHGAVLHGCTIRRNALVGMLSVVMDEAELGEDSILGASSFVKSGLIIPPRSLAAGIPAKVLRPLGETEIAWKTQGTAVYQDLTRRCLASFRECAPLTDIEPGRPQLPAAMDPLHVVKREAGREG